MNESPPTASRRLAALMFTDMVGYSAVAFRNETLASELVSEQRDVIRKCLITHHGREHQTTGDGFFLEFSSAVEAVRCAIAIQSNLRDRDRHLPIDRQIKIRIGIHLGDILIDGTDISGNGVNLAARIEPLATPGGICITRQVHDQVHDKIPGVLFQKIGRRQLKNIKSGAEVYRIRLPWQNFKSRPTNSSLKFSHLFKGPSTINSSLLTLLFVSCLGLLSIALGKALSPVLSGSLSSIRNPASQHTQDESEIDLAGGWSYQNGGTAWHDFNTRSTWSYADAIKGDYILKKNFPAASNFKEPAIVLGLIPDSHRVYLNGRFVGGSDQYGDLAYYPFDPSLLFHDKENTIVVNAHTRPTLNPGLVLLPEVGAFLGEFSRVREAVMRNQVRFHILKNIYFVHSILTFLLCFGFACFYRNSSTYFYCALILLLGSLHLAYYSPWISAVFDYRLVRFFKVLGLSISPMVLFSAYLCREKKYRLELFNNALTVASALVMAFLLLDTARSQVQFTQIYNAVLYAAAIYSAVWILGVLMFATWKTRYRLGVLVNPWRLFKQAFTFEGIYLISAVIGISSLLVATKMNGRVELLAPSVYSLLVDLSLAAPFLFSVFVIVMTTIDYAFQRSAAGRKRKRDELVLSIVHLMQSSKDSQEMITELLARTSEFIEARRATLYVTEQSGGATCLRAASALGYGEDEFQSRVMLSITKGVVGFACQNRTPLLIEDIKSDSRFSGPGAPFPIQGFAGYTSGTCMIFPLISGGRLVGALTFTDKKDKTVFRKEDFSLGLLVTSGLAMILDNRQMRGMLKLESASA